MNYFYRNKTKNGLKLDKGLAKKAFIGSSALFTALSATFIYRSMLPSTFASETESSFEVKVAGTLSVAVTTPDTWAAGDAGEFLRNTVKLSVATNDGNGFTASMYSDKTTDLTNTSRRTIKLPTLASSSTKSSFPDNRWGYSLKNGSYNNNTYNETDAGNSNSNYYPLVSTSASPITVLTGSSGSSSAEQNIYFGAKANSAQAAGTYTGTVLISVVTGTVNSDSNPITPTNPATNSDTTANQATWIPDSSNASDHTMGRTVYYTTSNSVAESTTTTTTEVTTGDVRSSYANPAGVTTKTTSNINDSSLALGLATTASVAAASGIFFFILAKRREEDEEEEEQQQ